MLSHDKYLDVLQNIEFAIVSVYKYQNELTDYEVTFALEALIDFYISEQRNREPRKFNLSDNSTEVYEEVKRMCDFRLGRTALGERETEEPISSGEIVECLKKIKNSVNKWTKQSGRQGYLDFVKDYV